MDPSKIMVHGQDQILQPQEHGAGTAAAALTGGVAA